MDIKLYMSLELTKLKTHHIDGIWTLPLKNSLSFTVFVFGNFKYTKTTIYKQEVNDKWECSEVKYADYDIINVLIYIKNNIVFNKNRTIDISGEYNISGDVNGSEKSKLIFCEMVKYLKRV
ncbi:hypothetical protein NAPIS_ORF00340 [Vairimorpha apis BRL 01]|uniref:Uncharacterized protein n=1 Tax=Vairimorpha apis BRL 01 TaxID=1037528 RepID=T0MM45_9MICR|nr:hypothetical protein NAPIS_ORF00340 [Vairimorpha apis BRL 01]